MGNRYWVSRIAYAVAILGLADHLAEDQTILRNSRADAHAQANAAPPGETTDVFSGD